MPFSRYSILVELPDRSGWVPMRLDFESSEEEGRWRGIIVLALESESGKECAKPSSDLINQIALSLEKFGIQYTTYARKERDELGEVKVGSYESDVVRIPVRKARVKREK